MIARRLSRLNLGEAFYAILALDHGLTVGVGEGVPAQRLEDVANDCAGEIGGVVLNYGMASSWASRLRVPIVLQCFGAPLGAQRRVKTASIEQALRLDAAAVAVQLNLALPDVSAQTREICDFVSSAHVMEMPVLFMVSGVNESNLSDVAKSIRVCQELGANLIKVSCKFEQATSSAAKEDMTSIIRHAPPVLIAGGPANADIVSVAREAHRCGFSGYCIGRSIFHADSPRLVAAGLTRAFQSNRGQ